MTSLDLLGGSALGGTLYGIGVGPGDARYLTLRAAALVKAVDVVAYFAKRGRQGNARRIVDALMAPGRAEVRFEYPLTDELPAENPEYQRQIGDFYRQMSETLAMLLREGKSVGLLAEGDPFFYGSFMHMWRRLEADFPIEVVPGVTGMSGCWTRANVPITWGDDTLSVLPGTLEEQRLVDHRPVSADQQQLRLRLGDQASTRLVVDLGRLRNADPELAGQLGDRRCGQLAAPPGRSVGSSDHQLRRGPRIN